MLVHHISFWVCGLDRSLAWDYAPGIPQGEAAERRFHWREKPIGSLVYKILIRWCFPLHEVSKRDQEREEFGVPPAEDKKLEIQGNTEDVEEGCVTSPALPRSQSAIQRAPSSTRESVQHRLEASNNGSIPGPPIWKRFLKTMAVMITPMNSVVVVSFVVALVQPLKALFVDISDVGGPSWAGPDGNPPLSFIIDTGSQRNTLFMGLWNRSNDCNFSWLRWWPHGPIGPYHARWFFCKDEDTSPPISSSDLGNRACLFSQDGSAPYNWHLPRASDGRKGSDL